MTHRKADFKNENFKTEQRYQRLNTWGGQKKKNTKGKNRERNEIWPGEQNSLLTNVPFSTKDYVGKIKEENVSHIWEKAVNKTLSEPRCLS